MIDFSFAKEKDRLKVQVNILTKDFTLYIFVVSDERFSAEIIAESYEKYAPAKEKLPLIEPVILRAWEEFRRSLPQCSCDEFLKHQEQILKLISNIKAKLYEEIGKIVELKDPEFKPSSYLVIVQKEGRKNEIPLN